MIYGCARVSNGRPESRFGRLRDAGALTVFRDVASGAQIDWTQLARLLGQLDAGSMLMVTRLDRLVGAIKPRLVEHALDITAKEAGFRSLGET